MRRLRVLVVDDSVVARRLVTEALQQDPTVDVVGTAPNGRIALARLDQLAPDAVILDVEMPELDGLATLRALRRTHPSLPVIMFSNLTRRGAVATLDALALGATDYVTKPVGHTIEQSLQIVGQELIPRLKAFCPASDADTRSQHRPHESQIRLRACPDTEEQYVEAVVIAASTGGPNALTVVLSHLAPNLPVPLFIVQHMPPPFTRYLAERLSAKSRIPVREAADGASVRPGTVWLAAGGVHMTLRRDGSQVHLALTSDPPENSCRPSADVLFRSAAAVYGDGTLAVVLTGMGHDGLRGSERVAQVGGRVLVQNEATSVVWGMPGIIARAGLAHRMLPLEDLGAEINSRVATGRSASVPQAVRRLF